MSLYNSQLKRYFTVCLCLCCSFSLWGSWYWKNKTNNNKKRSSETKHRLQKTILMSKNKKSIQRRERVRSLGIKIMFCFSLSKQLVSVRICPGREEYIPGSTEGRAPPPFLLFDLSLAAWATLIHLGWRDCRIFLLCSSILNHPPCLSLSSFLLLPPFTSRAATIAACVPFSPFTSDRRWIVEL